jgi:transcriptional regulator with XRE-family HTH domain
MQEHTSNMPYKSLGNHLRYLRQQIEESVAEVSGAVEIDIEELEKIEQGIARPTEDILMLLINHFDVQDTEAVRLWDLAGYDGPRGDRLSLGNDLLNKTTTLLLAIDTRTMYTDGVLASANKQGVEITFTHGRGQPVARLGMSREQANQVIHTLQIALLKSQYLDGPQALPAPNTDSSQPK